MISKYPAVVVLSALVFCGLTGAAQHKKDGLREDPHLRMVEGVVTYAAHEPVVGAVVKCEDTKTLEIRSYITESDGKYHFANLSTDRDYTLKAEKNGRESNTERLSQFNEHKVATVNLHLK